MLTEAEKQGKPTTELEAEAKRAYEALVAAVQGAGYLAQYLSVFPEYQKHRERREALISERSCRSSGGSPSDVTNAGAPQHKLPQQLLGDVPVAA